MKHIDFKYAIVDNSSEFINVADSIVSDNGQVKQILKPTQAKKKTAHIDWLNFTFHESNIEKIKPYVLSDNDLIIGLSEILQPIFGFSITSVRNNGAFFYARSYELGDNYGLVCHGGQANTVLVSINGTGLSQALPKWNIRLYEFFTRALPKPLPNSSGELVGLTITRIDLAYDDFKGVFSVDRALRIYLHGGFQNGKRPPSVSQAGNWLNPDGSGRTLYIGKRTNGLFCRVYEKGLQLNSQESPKWVRVEVELKSVDRVIPYDVLLFPEKYLAGSFPCLRFINQKQSKIKTYQHEVKADLNHRTEWAKRQTGAFLNLLTQLGHTNDEIIEKLKTDSIPKPFRQKFLVSDKQAIQVQSRSDFEPTSFKSELDN